MKKPLISIVVIFDKIRKEKLVRLLESMKNQLSLYPTEIVLIHESNTLLPAPELPVPVRYVTIPEKRGIPFNRNQGLQQARGEIIVFIDDDVVVEPNWLSELMRCYKDKDIAAVGGSEIKPYSTGIMRKIWFKMRRNVTGKILSSGEVISNFSPYKKQVEGVDCLPGANMSIRADVLKRIGGYDEFYGGNGYREETDFGPRIIKLGMKILFNPKASLYHKESNAGGNVSAMDIKKWCYWYYRNHTYFYMIKF